MNIPIRHPLFAALLAISIFIPGSLNAAAPSGPQGVITVKEFLNISGTSIPALTDSPKFPNSPDVVDYSPRFEWPTGPDDATPPAGDVKNNYGIQIIGYIFPPVTGDYVFAIAADDNAVLYLSTDSDPAKKVEIAIEPGWNPVRKFGEAGQSRRTQLEIGTANERWNNFLEKNPANCESTLLY